MKYATYLPGLAPVVYDRKSGKAISPRPPATPSPTLKRCSRCRYHLPTASFHKNASKPDGLQYYCCVCQCRAAAQSAAKRRLVAAPEVST